MSTTTLIKVLGQQFVDKLEIDLSQYPTLPQQGHGLFQPKDLLGTCELSVEKEHFEQVEKAIDGEFNTGEIWKDTFYGVIYFILGKIGKEHLIITLGGDTRSHGVIEKALINNDAKNVYCDRIIFKPKV